MKITRNGIRNCVIIHDGELEICVNKNCNVMIFDNEIENVLYNKKLNDFKEVLQIVNFYLFEY